MSNFKTILHPTDFSSSAGEALQIASSLSRQHERQAPSLARRSATCDERWRNAGATAAGIKDVAVEARLAEGEPAVVIVDLRETGADLIVIGSHGRSGLSRLLMGSVAEHVVRKASCPVLTVKTLAK